jgi:hypothetical protein
MKKAIDLLREAIGILELELKKPFEAKVELSTLKAGEVFETSFGEMIVLDNSDGKTTVITKGFVKDKIKFDNESPNFAESDISEYLSGEVLEMFEEEFGSENLVEHTTDVISVDMQQYESYTGKVRLLTFDEARKYNELIVNKELDRWYWSMTPWSTAERGWKYSVAVVSPSGDFYRNSCYDGHGVRPVCIFSSSIFESGEVKEIE